MLRLPGILGLVAFGVALEFAQRCAATSAYYYLNVTIVNASGPGQDHGFACLFAGSASPIFAGTLPTLGGANGFASVTVENFGTIQCQMGSTVTFAAWTTNGSVASPDMTCSPATYTTTTESGLPGAPVAVTVYVSGGSSGGGTNGGGGPRLATNNICYTYTDNDTQPWGLSGFVGDNAGGSHVQSLCGSQGGATSVTVNGFAPCNDTFILPGENGTYGGGSDIGHIDANWYVVQPGQTVVFCVDVVGGVGTNFTLQMSAAPQSAFLNGLVPAVGGCGCTGFTDYPRWSFDSVPQAFSQTTGTTNATNGLSGVSTNLAGIGNTNGPLTNTSNTNGPWGLESDMVKGFDVLHSDLAGQLLGQGLANGYLGNILYFAGVINTNLNALNSNVIGMGSNFSTNVHDIGVINGVSNLTSLTGSNWAYWGSLLATDIFGVGSNVLGVASNTSWGGTSNAAWGAFGPGGPGGYYAGLGTNAPGVMLSLSNMAGEGYGNFENYVYTGSQWDGGNDGVNTRIATDVAGDPIMFHMSLATLLTYTGVSSTFSFVRLFVAWIIWAVLAYSCMEYATRCVDELLIVQQYQGSRQSILGTDVDVVSGFFVVAIVVGLFGALPGAVAVLYNEMGLWSGLSGATAAGSSMFSNVMWPLMSNMLPLATLSECVLNWVAFRLVGMWSVKVATAFYIKFLVS